MQRDPTNSNRRHSFGVLTSSSSAALNAPYAASQSGKAPSANATALSLSRSMSIASNAGGPMRRSHSKSTLFNEDVLEVSLLKSPARNTNIRAPYQPGVQGSGSDRAPAHGHAQQEVAVLDRLQGQERELWVKVDPTHTVEYLKTRIQSRQGQEGRRIIPAHIQVLIFNGRERDDNEMVRLSVAAAHPGPAPPNAPLVLELHARAVCIVLRRAGARSVDQHVHVVWAAAGWVGGMGHTLDVCIYVHTHTLTHTLCRCGTS